MKIVNLSKTNIPYLENITIALGFFDGIHLGHQAIIKQAFSYAQKNHHKLAVFTFVDHPKNIIDYDNKIQIITTQLNKSKILATMGVDYLVVFQVSRFDLKRISAKSFVNKYLMGIGTKHIVCGKDFRFGKNREGKANQINRLSNYKITTNVVNLLEIDGFKVSSQLIKQFLKNNDIKQANKFLGYDFFVTGKVYHGQKVGRKLGFKTANINLIDNFSLLLHGVFAVLVNYKNKTYQGIANIGYRPTRKNSNSLKNIECYIFNFNKNIYGQIIDIKFKAFIRKEQKFSSLKKLNQQITQDVKWAKMFFGLK